MTLNSFKTHQSCYIIFQMGNASDEEQPAVVEQVDAPDIATSSQMTFCVAVKKGSLSTASSQGSLYLEWSIITDPTDIDGPEDDNEIETGSSTIGGEENEESESSDEEGDEENTPDTINNIEESGRALDHVETPWPLAPINPFPSVHLPKPGPLQGYKYTEFRPTPINQNSPVDAHMSPTQSNTLTTLKDLKKILHPQRDTGRGYKDPKLDLWCHARLDGMFSMLNMFTNPQSLTYNQWGASAFQTAIRMGQGTHCARRLCELNRALFADWKVLPINPFREWNKSLLVNENIMNKVSIYLLSLGKEITTKKLMDFLHQADIKEKYGIEHDISHKTVCRYLQALGYLTNLHQRGSMLMVMKGRTLLLIARILEEIHGLDGSMEQGSHGALADRWREESYCLVP